MGERPMPTCADDLQRLDQSQSVVHEESIRRILEAMQIVFLELVADNDDESAVEVRDKRNTMHTFVVAAYLRSFGLFGGQDSKYFGCILKQICYKSPIDCLMTGFLSLPTELLQEIGVEVGSVS